MVRAQIFGILAAILPLAAQASPAAPKMYDLDLKVERNGKAIPVGRLSVIEGEKAEFTDTNANGGSFVEVVAKEHKGQAGQVLVELTVGDIDAKGKRTTVAQPRIIALENQTATVTDSTSAKGKRAKEDVSVSVNARSEN